MNNGLIIYLIGFALALVIVKFQHVIEELFIEIEARRKKKQRDTLIKSTRELLDRARIDYSFMNWNPAFPFYIKIKTLDELSRVRANLRNCFGKWEDKKSNIGAFGDQAYCEWQGKNLPIQIELKCDPLNFPKELQGEQCKMVYSTSSSWGYVCERESF